MTDIQSIQPTTVNEKSPREETIRDETEPVEANHNDMVVSASNRPVLFLPGQVVATPGALAALEANQCLPLDLLQRHLTGDWGVLYAEDETSNEEAVAEGLRILSNYPLADGSRLWIITEADRSVTTLLLPEDY